MGCLLETIDGDKLACGASIVSPKTELPGLSRIQREISGFGEPFRWLRDAIPSPDLGGGKVDGGKAWFSSDSGEGFADSTRVLPR
jgi:hypothetical protein